MGKVTWNSDPALKKIRDAAAAALKEEAQMLGDLANDTVPRDDNDLADSLTVTRRQLKARIAYKADHAIRQHEDRRLKHKPGTRAKWLELTLREQSPQIVKRIGARMRRRLG
jgi:hypothetical protein